jgi:amidase
MKSLKTFYAIVLVIVMSCTSTEKPAVVLNIHNEITIEEIQSAYSNGEYSIEDLTGYYLDRIDEISFNGPQLNAVITVNPDALEIARELDAELSEGKSRGPLHGIPVLLKDNVDTGDKMPCTAGAIAMADSYPLQDSPLAAQLRAAGAVILGKANLSEWANFHSNYSSSGWSGLGGQTRNPYDITRNPCGSSAGSGVAVAANLCVLAIGTETNGSIVCPSNANGIVGIKPTVGLISRTGIIPISFTQDTGGPMARSVSDAVIALGAMTAVDSADEKTLNPDRLAQTDYTEYLNSNGLQGKKIGVWKRPSNNNQRVTGLLDEAVSFMESQGATVVEVERVLPSGTGGDSYQVLLYEFKDGLNKYFAGLGPDASVKSLEELIEKTLSDSIEMQYHDHQILVTAQEKGSLEDEDYLKALESAQRKSQEEGIDKVMTELELDAIIAPTGSPAWKTDLTNGDNFSISSSSPAAIAGYPNITVPMGQLDGLPVGLSIFGKAWTEGKLIEIAYAYEQGTQHRFSPTIQ